MPLDILIVAARRNREIDGVIDGLRDHGLAVRRLATCQYPECESITWTPEANLGNIYGSPRVAWLCDFSGWSFEDRLTGLEREVAVSESTAFVEGSLLDLDCKWLNSPQAARSASRKLYQLGVARRLGVAIPETCVSNSSSVIRDFCKSHARVVAKTLSVGFVRYDGQQIKFYTRRVDETDDKVFDGLRFGPLIFQVEIEKTEEIRVTVVDDQAFAVRFSLSGIGSDEVDIRRHDYKSHRDAFSACHDRPDILDASRKISRALNLSYAGIDWAVDVGGQAFFLECNPFGSFKWFEMCSGQDITSAITQALVRRC